MWLHNHLHLNTPKGRAKETMVKVPNCLWVPKGAKNHTTCAPLAAPFGLKQPGSVVVQHGKGTLRLRLQCSEVHNPGAVPPLSPLLLPSGGQQIHAVAWATAVADPHVEVLAKALGTTFMVVLNHEHLQAGYVWSSGLIVTAYHYKYAPGARDTLVSPSHGTKNFFVMCYGSNTRHDAFFCGAWLADEVAVLQVDESLTVRPLPQGSTGEMGRNGIVCAWQSVNAECKCCLCWKAEQQFVSRACVTATGWYGRDGYGDMESGELTPQ